MSWSWPSPAMDGTTDGFVFYGTEPVTVQDYWDLFHYLTSDPDSTWETLEDMWEAGIRVDELSLVGLHDRNWSCNFYKDRERPYPGGLGSRPYESQYVKEEGWKVPSMKSRERGMWFIKPDGSMVKGLPHGMVYTVDDDTNYAVYDEDDGDEVGYYFDTIEQLYRPY